MKRRRARKVVEVAPEPVAEAPPVKRTRTRKVAAADPVQEPLPEPVAAPKRTRTRKVAAAEPSVANGVSAEPIPAEVAVPKPARARRTTKPA